MSDDTSPNPAPDPPRRDIYGRKPYSQSRGKTHDRIMALQRADGTLPGAELLFAEATGNVAVTSIGGELLRFLDEHVISMPITSRRAYERSLVLLLRDLDESGPAPTSPMQALGGDRFIQHLQWRVRAGLDEPAELTRCAVQLGHLTEWLHERGHSELTSDRDALRAAAAGLS